MIGQGSLTTYCTRTVTVPPPTKKKILCASFEGHFRTQIIKMGTPNPASLSPGNSVVEPRNQLMSPQVILMLTKVRRNELEMAKAVFLEQGSRVLTGVPQPGKGPSTQQDP